MNGRQEIIAFLTRKWARELDYRLIKELWMFEANRIAVRFAYEWHDDSGQWYRSYGNVNWEFNEDGLMRWRLACINDLSIKESDRKYHWPLGRRPDSHPGLTDLGLAGAGYARLDGELEQFVATIRLFANRTDAGQASRQRARCRQAVRQTCIAEFREALSGLD